MQTILDIQKRANLNKGPPDARLRKDRLSRCIELLLAHKDDFINAMNADFGVRSPNMSLFTDIAAAIVEPDDKLSAAQRLTLIEQASVEHSLANLRTFPWVRVRESKGQLTLNGAWFDISLGELNVYEEEQRRWTVV